MTQFEKEVIDRLGRIETKLDNDFRELHGNGQPGLIHRTGEIELRLGKVEDRLRQAEKSNRRVAGIVGWLVATAPPSTRLFSNSNRL